MIACPSVINLELRFLFAEVLPLSGSRNQLSLPRKFIFCRPNLKYGAWTSASFKSNAVPHTLVTEAAKVVLHKFLRGQGYSSALATATINKSDPFIEHLVSRLCSLQESGCPVGLIEFDGFQMYICMPIVVWSAANGIPLEPIGHELTDTEVSDALIPYLESLLEDYGSNLIDFLENFPNSPAKGLTDGSISSANLINSKELKALSKVTRTGPDGRLAPYVLYLLEFGMEVEQIKRIICRYPKFAYLSLDGKIKPMIEFLHSLGLSNSEISTILIKLPQLCSFNLSKKVIPTSKFLEDFGLSQKQVGRIIFRFPIVVALSRQKLESIVDFLYEMGLSAEEVGKVIHRFPQITGCSLENNLIPTVEYFRSLGVGLNVLLLRWPQALSLSIEDNLKPTTEFFLKIGYSKEGLATLISKLGALYTCSLSKNLIPKWEFFLTMNHTKEELFKFPQYFTYSLEGRIKPRYAAVEESGVKFTLSRMLTPSDVEFDKALESKIKRARGR